MITLVLSFDDGRRDNYRIAKEVLEPLGIPATFNITSGYVMRSIADRDKPGAHEPMTYSELKELSSNQLFEIAGHGVTHDNDIDNLLKGVLDLRDLCGQPSGIKGIASPHSQFDLTHLEEAKSLFMDHGIRYLRVSNDYSRMGRLKIWIRRINRFIHSGYLYYRVNRDSIMAVPGFLLFSVPVIRDNRIREVQKFMKYAGKENRDCICILMFHSVLRPGEKYYTDLFTWDYKVFQQFCEYLVRLREADKIRLAKTIDLF